MIADFIVLEGRKVCNRVVDGDAGGKRESFFLAKISWEIVKKFEWRTLVHLHAFNRFVVYGGSARLDEFIAFDT